MRSDCGVTIEINHIPRKPFPGFTQALGVMLASIIVLIPTALIINILLWLINIESIDFFAKNIAFHIASLLIIIYFYKRYVKLSFHEVFFLNRFSSKIILPLLATILGLGIVLSQIDNIFRLIFPMPKFVHDFYMAYLYSYQYIIPCITATVIIVPIIEELMCRGLILHGFLGRYRTFNAIILSSMLFALLHLNPWKLIGAFVIGCFLGWILINTRSLFPCIIAHAFNNLLSKIIFYTNIKIPGLTFDETNSKFVFQPLWLDLCGILLVILGIIILRKLFSKKYS